MQINTKLAAAALAAFVIVGGMAVTAGQAEAGFRGKHHHGFHGKFGWKHHGYHYWHGCRWVELYNKWGDYIGSKRRCYW